MLVSNIMTRVRNIAGDLNSLQFTDSMLLDWINDGIRECAISNKLLQKRATTTSIAGQGDYNLPSDILRLHSVKFNGSKLRVLTLEEFDSYTGASTTGITGTPTACYVWAGSLTLYPAPDTGNLDLVIDYIYSPEVIEIGSVDTELTALPVMYHARLVDYCLAQVAQQDDDLPRYQAKMTEFQTGVRTIKDMPEAEQDLYPTISIAPRDMGAWEDPYDG